MSQGGFRVDLESLGAAAGGFEGVADRVSLAATRFAGAAQPHPETFGLLPAAQAAHGAYAARIAGGVAALNTVHTAFRHSLAGGLRATAANYARLDALSRPGR